MKKCLLIFSLLLSAQVFAGHTVCSSSTFYYASIQRDSGVAIFPAEVMIVHKGKVLRNDKEKAAGVVTFEVQVNKITR